jgi:Sulfatase
MGKVSERTLAALDCFIVLGLLGIYLKFALLGPQWTAIARFLGESAAESLPLTSRLGFFVEDVWLNLLAIPLTGLLAVLVCFGRRATVAAAIVSAVIGLAYFVELQVQKQLGQYLSREIANDLLGWAINTSESTFDYVTIGSLLKLAAFVCVLGAIVFVQRQAIRSTESPRLRRVYRGLLWIPAATAMTTAVAIIPVALSSSVPASPLTASSLASAAAMLLKRSDAGSLGHSIDSTLAAFRQLTHTEPFDGSSSYVGHERDSDAIIFMMETGAAQALDLAVDGRGLPGIGPLYPRAFVASRHYTTHPYSSDAMYSAFSGLYPQGRRRVLQTAPPGSLKGLMTNLSPGMPMRRVYVPSLYHIELDDEMYEAFGAELVYVADESARDPLREVAERRAESLVASLERGGSEFDWRTRGRLRTRLSADFQALEKAKADIADAIRGNQRYAVMFFPEIGHGPWVSLHSERSVLERGRALMILQDTWLKEILDVVRNFGRLDRTVVVVTGDHGVRTRAEDTSLPVGEISDYMFRVPFFVYAPQTLSSTVRIDEPTSHIDLAPTLLALFGQSHDLGLMQGIPIWQRSAANRIYLLAFVYGGADGFVENRRYYMRQGLSGATFVSNRFLFEDHDQVSSGDPIAGFVDGELKKLDALQQAIVSYTIETIRN